ncbi:3776_t:CDS:2 [Cetraspora pellucida]|uniref:3776_t:CDS:1 n=1 Tax=Cetraspora pellucida TaxID=1433469 RepID=A0A9N9GQE1_9GLOM|nr:3776_t:CDS:2 [Cetraspora pellucida]
MKLLASYNRASQNKLQKLYNNQSSICDDVKLQQLLERDDLCLRKKIGPWKYLKDLPIADHYQYPIAIAFKIVDRSRTKEKAIELGYTYELFIRTLSLPEITKEHLCNNMFANCLSEE